MTRSMGEVEATARKAARGAGYPWGISEEAGSAALWLEVRGLSGCAALVKLLQVVSEREIASLAPVQSWASQSGVLCPILTGAALSDQAVMLDHDDIVLGQVLSPILLLPFIAHLADVRGCVTSLDTASGMASAQGEHFEVAGTWEASDSVVHIRTQDLSLPETKLQTRANPAPATWEQLEHFAAKTYAPATEASRLKGAGAGLTDND